jgi:hypothetical protein
MGRRFPRRLVDYTRATKAKSSLKPYFITLAEHHSLFHYRGGHCERVEVTRPLTASSRLRVQASLTSSLQARGRHVRRFKRETPTNQSDAIRWSIRIINLMESQSRGETLRARERRQRCSVGTVSMPSPHTCSAGGLAKARDPSIRLGIRPSDRLQAFFDIYLNSGSLAIQTQTNPQNGRTGQSPCRESLGYTVTTVVVYVCALMVVFRPI